MFGDTSGFHLGSAVNYGEFRKLLRDSSDILSEIPYDFFVPPPIPPTPFVNYRAFKWRLKASPYWRDLRRCERIVVHGEGLTCTGAPPAYLCMHVGFLAKELGVEAWLVNFGAYHAGAFVEQLREFDYIAARDPITVEHLSDLGIAAELSFDCCVLSVDRIPPLHREPHEIVAIRGKKQRALLNSLEGTEHTKLNAAWRWTRLGSSRGRLADLVGIPDSGAIEFRTLPEYIEYMSRARFAVTTSFHANIFSFLAGIPFVTRREHPIDRKYEGTVVDLVPAKYRDLDLGDVLAKDFDEDAWRAETHRHYCSVFDSLRQRALNNVP